MKQLKQEFIKLSPSERLYQYDRPVIAITGGIATGKSTVTKLLSEKGLKIIDADQLVKDIYAQEEAKNFIRTNFPEAWVNENIEFKKLRELFFQDKKVQEAVEAYIYHRLPGAFKEAAEKITDQSFYIYDVPLLFERNLQDKVDVTVVVYAPEKVQIERLIKRDQINPAAAKNILNKQMDIEEKKSKADLVIDNSGTIDKLGPEVDKIINTLLF
ncbi:MAG: dephospho-CoA kinase [Bacteriovoracia bacterium]